MEERKKYILDNVGQLYLKYGIRSVTMDDVASELGISKKTLYEFFNDKESLVRESIQYIMQNPDLIGNCKEGKNSIDRILFFRSHWLKMLKVYNNNLDFDLKRIYPEMYNQVMEFKKKRIYAQTFEILEQGKKEGLVRKEINSEIVSKLQVGRILLIFNPEHDIFSDEDVTNVEVLDSVLEYHIHAICTEKGKQYYKQQLNNNQNETNM